ncbi:hypothetical protein WME91_45525 [Sorangium sp. So ce269]
MEADGKRPSFERLFIQYIRLKCALYRHLVADPDVHGLHSFGERFHRSHIYHSAELRNVSLASTVDEVGVTVAAVEVRCVPKLWSSIRRDFPYPLDGSQKNSLGSRLESAWVIHFTRSYPGDGIPLYRRAYNQREKAAHELCELLHLMPDVLCSVRGLDLAAVESNEPLWASLPHIVKLRTVSVSIASQYPERRLEPLRLTLHVGEDFAHVASGLRAIHEPFAWNLMHRGDRLGHATALGIDIEGWAKKNPLVKVSKWDRLLDLAWMRYSIWRFEIPIALPVIRRMDNEAVQLATAIWGSQDAIMSLFRDDASAPPTTTNLDYLAAGWIALGNPKLFEALDYPVSKDNPQCPLPIGGDGEDCARTPLPKSVSLSWLHSYLWSPRILAAARDKIEVGVELDISLLLTIQKKLAELVARWQVAIEVNPTSNLIVAGFAHPLDQPMFRLRPVDPKERGCVPLILSSDDPLTFATCLADEFAYAWAGMVVAGEQPASYAQAWLEEAATTSMRMRFTVHRRRDE